MRVAGRICRGIKRGSRERIPLTWVGGQKRHCPWLKLNTEVDEEKKLNKKKDSDTSGRANKILKAGNGVGLKKERKRMEDVLGRLVP
jgi:hypothetical protein